MASGGKREGAGRKKGSIARATVAAKQKALETGISPLEYMLKVMRDETADDRRRDDMAKAASPYVHSRLSSVVHSGSVGTYDLTSLKDEDLDRLESILGSAVVRGDQGRTA